MGQKEQSKFQGFNISLKNNLIQFSSFLFKKKRYNLKWDFRVIHQWKNIKYSIPESWLNYLPLPKQIRLNFRVFSCEACSINCDFWQRVRQTDRQTFYEQIVPEPPFGLAPCGQCVNVTIWKFVNAKMCNCANVQICKYAIVKLWKSENVKRTNVKTW